MIMLKIVDSVDEYGKGDLERASTRRLIGRTEIWIQRHFRSRFRFVESLVFSRTGRDLVTQFWILLNPDYVPDNQWT